MRNSCTSVFPNTCAWEQQERNKTEKEKKIRRDACAWKEVKRARKNAVPKAKTIAQAYLPPGSLRPQTVDEFPN